MFILGLIFSSVFCWSTPRFYSQIAITGPTADANEYGKLIAKNGGNVVDVAVAVGLAMTVTNPFNASIGAGGFALIKTPKKPVVALDFRETAPAKTHPKYFLNQAGNASIDGGKAVGVPGYLLGLWEMHKKFGKLPWQKLVLGAINLAEHGFQVGGQWVQRTKSNENRFNVSGKKFFMLPSGQHYQPGQIHRQPQLAKALKSIKRNVQSVYSGEIAQDIVHTVQESGGDLSLQDLREYKVRWLKPLEGHYLKYKLYLMPPPSSGGVVTQVAFALFEKLKMIDQRPLSFEEIHLIAEVLKVSFQGRALLGDPDFTSNPIDSLLSNETIEKWSQKISKNKVLQLKPLQLQDRESSETTHFTVMDKNGSAVSLTVTLNGAYGSGLVTSKYGITLNNEMDDFSTRLDEPNMYGLVQGHANRVEPKKRPLSSMSPTLIGDGENIIAALGAPGGPRIISGVILTMYRLLVSKMDIDQAIQSPRVHHQFLPDIVYYERNLFSPELIESLEKKGHKVEEAKWMARVNGIRLNEEGQLEAAFDSRGEGNSSGF